jgi:hypothetical protein
VTVKSCKARNTDEEFVVVQGRIGFEPRRSTTGKGQLTLSRPRQQHVCKGAARHSAANHLRSVDDHDRGSLCAFAAGIRLYAGHTLLIAAVGLRLVFIRPDLELDDHLRHRQTSAIVLMVSSLAIAISFVDPEVALWALALNFALPLIRKWSGRAASLG